MKNISELILAIKSLKSRNYFFQRENLPTLNDTEKILNIQFPTDIHEFYSIYNGGFIPDALISEKKINDGRFFDEIEWASNSFLSLEDIIYYYNSEDKYSIHFKREENLNSKRLIPFFRSKEQEFLVFNEDSAILWPKEIDNNKTVWIEVCQNFENFLYRYIENEGLINL